MFITVPIPTRDDQSEIDPFRIDVNNQVCSKTPFTLSVLSADNCWTTLLSLMLSDKDFACLKAAVLEADEKRHAMKVEAYEMLRQEFDAAMPDDPESVTTLGEEESF